MSHLSDKINGELERRGWSGESVRGLSDRSGGTLNKDMVAVYRNGTHGRPSERILRAWADLLGCPIEDLRAAAAVPVGAEERYVPPAEADRLSPRQRDAITELIRSIVTDEQGGGTRGNPAPNTPLSDAEQDALLSVKSDAPVERRRPRRASKS